LFSNDKDEIEEALSEVGNEIEDQLNEDYEDADGIRGGQLYSKFWADETEFSVSNSSLDSEDQLSTISESGDFFRCKQCHGWDRLGREGAYSSRAPSTTQPNVSAVDLVTIASESSAEELFDKIMSDKAARRDISTDLSTYDPESNSADGDRMPNFSQILTDEQVWDLVKYLKEDALDTTALYTLSNSGGDYPEGQPVYDDVGANGDAVNGDALYVESCEVCHGSDGASGSVGLIDGEYSVGYYARNKPYETQHKVKFGHLGSPMVASSDSSINTVLDDPSEAMFVICWLH